MQCIGGCAGIGDVQYIGVYHQCTGDISEYCVLNIISALGMHNLLEDSISVLEGVQSIESMSSVHWGNILI